MPSINIPADNKGVIETFDSDRTYKFLRLCTQMMITGKDFITFAQLVTDKTVNVNKNFRDGLSPLHVLCATYSHDNLMELVQLLVDNGADVNAKTLGGSNPLHLLCGCYRRRNDNLIELVQLFIESGCDINAKDGDGWSPLFRLCKNYRNSNLIELVKLLVEAGADPTAKTTDGCNLLHIVCHRVKRVIDGDLIPINLVQFLIEKGVDVNDIDPEGCNPLHILCRYCENEENLLDLTLIFKENGIDMKARTNEGYTAAALLSNRFDIDQNNHKMRKVIEILSS